MPAARAHPHALDAGPRDLLAVVELQALQAAAVLQVLQGHVGDEQAVVQLQHPQPLVATGAVAQVQDAVVRDELAVGQALEGEAARCRQEPRLGRLGLGAAASLIVPPGVGMEPTLQGTVRAERTLNSPLPANSESTATQGPAASGKKHKNQLANLSTLGRGEELVQVGRGGHGLS